MARVFKTRNDVKIFAVIAAVFVILFLLMTMNMSFEKEWYNREYEDYHSHPDAYSVCDAVITDFETRSFKNDSSLSLFNVYYTAVVEFNYAGGQKETGRIARSNDDSIGDTVSIAYDKRYDTDYEKMKKADASPEGTLGEYARTSEVSCTRNSMVLCIAMCITGLAGVLFVLWCMKKPEKEIFTY